MISYTLVYIYRTCFALPNPAIPEIVSINSSFCVCRYLLELDSRSIPNININVSVASTELTKQKKQRRQHQQCFGRRYDTINAEYKIHEYGKISYYATYSIKQDMTGINHTRYIGIPVNGGIYMIWYEIPARVQKLIPGAKYE